MAFVQVICEIYYKIDVYEVYSTYSRVNDFFYLEFENSPDAERFLATEGYIKDKNEGWVKPYRSASIIRCIREV
jgi:hypothetical protein